MFIVGKSVETEIILLGAPIRGSEGPEGVGVWKVITKGYHFFEVEKCSKIDYNNSFTAMNILKTTEF